MAELDAIADILKARGVTEVRYFHADHFEPWSAGVDVGRRAIDRFEAQTRDLAFGSAASLFYKVRLGGRLTDAATRTTAGHRVPGDGIVFEHPGTAYRSAAREAMGMLDRESGHEIHLHLHHEYLTRTRGGPDSPVARWVNAHSTADLDRQRMALLIRLAVEQVGQELGRPFERWGFVHGIWALNAADPTVCTIENEMALLMANGCFGDFSFPAGRAHCNPRLSVPFTCLPVEAVRAFDHPAARAIAAGKPGAADAGRFLVWSSPLRHAECSLDAYGRRRPLPMTDPEACVRAWLAKSPIAEGGNLVIKTHGHSLYQIRHVPLDEVVVPHAMPPVRATFDCLERVCDRAGVPIRPITAGAIPALLGLDAGPAPPSRTAGVTEVHSMPKPSSAALARMINRPIVKALNAWVSEDAENARQAGRFYLDRLGREWLFADYDLIVADYLASRFDPARTRIVEIACGFGTLGLLTAGHGFETLGVEVSQGRCAGGEIARDAAGQALRRLPGRLSFQCGAFPRDFPGRALEGDKQVVAVATNVIGTYTDRNLTFCLRALFPFDAVILDVGSFGRRREGDDRRAFFDALAGSWFEPVVAIHRRDPYDYWHFGIRNAFDAVAPDMPAAAPTLAQG